MRSQKPFASLLPSLLALLLCQSLGCDDGWKARSQENEGRFCVVNSAFPPDDDRDATVPLEPDTALTVLVRSEGCLSGSCSRRREGHCEVRRNGGTLELTSEFHWEETDGECTTDCVQLMAECKTPVLPAGEYTLRMGDQTFALGIPGQLPADHCWETLTKGR